jgi:cell wall-associated NlpC family hydrolase
MRGALVATVVAAAVGLVPTPATADPAATLNDLARQAEDLTEQYHRAQDSLAKANDELAEANKLGDLAANAAAAARSHEGEYRQQVDQLANASFQGAQFNQLSALLTSGSTQQYLDRSTMLEILASQNKASLDRLSGVVAQTAEADKQAQAARQRAQQATDEAAKIASDLDQRKRDAQAQLDKVKLQHAKLSTAETNSRNALGDTGLITGPDGVRGTALQAALTMRGKPYSWGGASPSSGFDCSGLVMYAYKQAGIDLPHSAQAQSAWGQPVARADLQPGDLVFFGSPGNIHHVGIAVGGDRMVDASDFGIPVRINPIQRDYATARRISG